tara:strand:+ start:721 stop:990 length:270 start_codon:yes stop_codon:yes gene_type:complete
MVIDDGINKEERKELIRLPNNEYFLVSRVVLPGTSNDWETMIFPSNSEGKVTDWLEEYVNNGYESIIDSVVKFAGNRGYELSDVEGDLA